MMIRLHFTEGGEPMDPQRVVSHSPRVVGATRNGHVELTIIPDGLGNWARRAAVAKARRHQPLLDQLQALASLVDSAGKDDGLDASRIADKKAAILSRARELADSIGDAAVAVADDGVRRIEREANATVERARTTIRRHPLRAIGLAFAATALLTAICRR